MRIAACAMLILVGAAVAQGAEVYRSTDSNGTVRYSDRPSSVNDQPVFVAAVPRGSRAPAEAAPRPAAAADGKADPATKADPNRGVQGEMQSPEQQAEVKAKNCGVAKQRQATYTEAHRLFKTTADGERQYLSDSDIDKARAQAEADVHTWCG